MKVSVIHNSLLPMAKETPPQGEEASSFHITLCDEIPIGGEDAEEAPLELEEGVRAAIDELKEVDLGTPENPRPIFISTLLSNEDEKIYVELLKEYIDVFAWTYKEMPGLDPKVVVHRLAVKKTYLSPLRKAYLHLHLSTWEYPECVSLFLQQKSQPLVMCRAVLEPQSQVLGALAFHHGSWSTPPLNPLCRDHGKCGLRHRVEVLILALELKSLSKCDVAVIQKEVSTILTSRAKPRRVFAPENPLTSINSVVMLSTAFSRRSDHLWRQQHEARGLEERKTLKSSLTRSRSGKDWRCEAYLNPSRHSARHIKSLKISPSNGNPPSMYKSRSDMDISPEERFSEEVKHIFSPFPVSWSVNEFASKIDVVTPLDLIINYAIPQRGKGVRGSNLTAEEEGVSGPRGKAPSATKSVYPRNMAGLIKLRCTMKETMIAFDAPLAAVDPLTLAAFSPPLQPSRRSEVSSVAPTRDSYHQMVRKTQPDEEEKKPTGIKAPPPLRRFSLSLPPSSASPANPLRRAAATSSFKAIAFAVNPLP
nr:uncharacterized protein LOC109154689 [Ipomoea trifida]